MMVVAPTTCIRPASANSREGFMFTRLAAIIAAFAFGSLISLATGGRAIAQDEPLVLDACFETFINLPMIADTRTERFDGKVDEAHARCRGGEAAVRRMNPPWVDWSNSWATADADSKAKQMGFGPFPFNRNKRGINGALIDLE